MILVVGANGSLGGQIAWALQQRGDGVRLLLRHGGFHPLQHMPGVEIAPGDLRDAESLRRACQGIQAVVTTASVSKTGGDSIENVDLAGNLNLIAAAEAAAVQHFVFTSTLSASEQSPVPLFRVKAEVERALRGSRMAHTILQPNAFMDVWFEMLIERPLAAGGPVTLVGDSRRRHAFIAQRDIVQFVLAALWSPAARNATLVLGGPAAVTLREVVHAYELAGGRPIDVQNVPPGSPIPGVPEPVWPLVAALETFDSPVPMDAMNRTYGVELTSIASFAHLRQSYFARSSSIIPSQ